ncbi:MAG: hypothetical protein GY913_01215 [Proteobacteria bacterium]|nr:hypothetical protein [Pseudomonadota bacterium]MCP4915518.1 hypothetical protein [Pseudomonadota bacterium]
MKLAIVCSSHGFGHLTRQLAVAEVLRDLGVDPTIFTIAPRQIVEATLPEARIEPWRVDVGIVQRDSLTEDLPATLERLDVVCSPTAIGRLARRLEGFDRVVVDTAPAALEACRIAGVEALAVGNFEWAWLYSKYPALRGWGERFRAWQEPHVGLELSPGPGLFSFKEVEQFWLVARVRPPHRVAERAVLVSFGGFGLDVSSMLPALPDVTWITAPPMDALDRPDCVHVSDVPYPALVAGADLVLTKPGYGILAECSAVGVPIAWLDRGAFPEAAALVERLQGRGDLQADPADLRPAILQLVGRRRDPVPLDTRRLAERLLSA